MRENISFNALQFFTYNSDPEICNTVSTQTNTLMFIRLRVAYKLFNQVKNMTISNTKSPQRLQHSNYKLPVRAT